MLKKNKAQEQIDFNPSEITFDRVENVYNETSGEFDKVETSYTETIRITKKNSFKISVNQDIGINNKADSFVLLGNYLSNMDNKYKDKFTYDGERYEIKSVIKMKEKGEITSVQAIAEVII